MTLGKHTAGWKHAICEACTRAGAAKLAWYPGEGLFMHIPQICCWCASPQATHVVENEVTKPKHCQDRMDNMADPTMKPVVQEKEHGKEYRGSHASCAECWEAQFGHSAWGTGKGFYEKAGLQVVCCGCGIRPGLRNGAIPEKGPEGKCAIPQIPLKENPADAICLRKDCGHEWIVHTNGDKGPCTRCDLCFSFIRQAAEPMPQPARPKSKFKLKSIHEDRSRDEHACCPDCWNTHDAGSKQPYDSAGAFPKSTANYICCWCGDEYGTWYTEQAPPDHPCFKVSKEQVEEALYHHQLGKPHCNSCKAWCRICAKCWKLRFPKEGSFGDLSHPHPWPLRCCNCGEAVTEKIPLGTTKYSERYWKCLWQEKQHEEKQLPKEEDTWTPPPDITEKRFEEVLGFKVGPNGLIVLP